MILRYNPIVGQNLAHLNAGAEGRIEPLLDVRVNRKELNDTTYVDGSAVSVKNEDNVRNSNGFTSSACQNSTNILEKLHQKSATG